MVKLPLLFITLVGMLLQEGTAPHCDNAYDTKDKCKCHRATMCERERPAGEDTHCKTYCKRDNCGCKDPCATTTQ